jgi:HEAT repeat protein
VVHALGEIGDARAVEPLIEALGPNVHFGVRRGAAVALGDIGDARAVEPLIRELSCDWDDMIRRFAAIALGKIGNERAVEPLIGVLEDEYVHDAAKEALKKLGHEVQ